MITNGRRFSSKHLLSNDQKILIRPKSGIMSLNPEPADAVERQENSLPEKTYADALEEAMDQDTDHAIDEDAIKETPPRPKHLRQSSEPRPLGEVIDEEEMMSSSPNRSPNLRHTRGRLENKSSRESYADAVQEHSPAPDNAIVNGNGVPPQALGTMANSEEKESKDRGDKMPQIAEGDGQDENKARVNKTPENGEVRSKDQNSTRGDKTPETLEGRGKDEEPRSPIRKAHKRVSSRQLNGTPKRQTSLEQLLAATSREEPPPPPPDAEASTDEKQAKDGQLIYENLRNKSGENLASIKPSDDYRLSLQQREDKPPTSEQPGEAKREQSELVSGRRAGAGWSSSAMRWAPLNVPIQRRLQTCMVLLHTLSIAGGLALFFLLCGIPVLWPILLPYLLYVLLSRASISGSLSHRSEYLRRAKIWSLFASYFPARLHRSHVLEPTRKYIFGYHPHGIISHGAFAAFGTEALGFSQLFPGITNTLLTLDTNFRIPLYRDYALRMGLASVSRESCENILSKGGPNGEGMGRAITIVVGGARESLDAKPYSLRLVLKKRKGFVKLAIRTGADLVPVLAFGENDIYDQFDASAHPHVHRAQLLVKKLLGFTVPLFHARGVFNYDVGLMPYRRPINLVVGKPIPIVQAKTPDPAYVDQIHSQYVDELVRIWDDWKDTFARHRNSELEIVE